MTVSTKDRLAETAAKLFHQRGFEAVGISDILKSAGVPKGSLYHHYPKGKSDLALAAANYASQEMLRIIDDAFAPAASYEDGMTTLFFKCAKLFDILGKWNGCPVSGILLNGSQNPEFRATSEQIFADWMTSIATHAMRLGLSRPDAQERATHLLVVLEGGWGMARSQRSSQVLRELPKLLAQGL